LRYNFLASIFAVKACDRLSLVTYDTQVYLDFPLTAMGGANKDKTKTIISKLRDGSSTNLCGGLVKGMEEVVGCKGERAQVQSVLLLTDGLANEGVKDMEGILAEMRRLQDPPAQAEVIPKKFDGTVYTFGFGSDHDSNLLEAISRQGGGVYYFIDSTDKIPESFADCLGGLLSVVGQNLSLEIEAVGSTTLSAVHASQPLQWRTHRKSCVIQLGDIQSEEERDIVLELGLPAVEASGGQEEEGPVVRASLTYFDIISSTLVDDVKTELLVTRRDGDQGPPSVAVDQQRNRVTAAAALRDADPLASQGKLEEARKVLQDAVALLEKSHTASSDYCKAVVEDLKRSLASIRSQVEYKSHGRQYIKSKMQTHSVQRSNFVDDHDYYQNQSKASYRSLSKK
jgi:hypothetical protein